MIKTRTLLISKIILPKKRDDYYLTELINAVQEDLDINKLIEKVMITKDKRFISDCWDRLIDMGIFTDEEIANFKEKFKIDN